MASRMVFARDVNRPEVAPCARLDNADNVVKVLTGFDKGVSFPLLSASFSK